MNKRPTLGAAILVLATIPLVSVACDDGIVNEGYIASEAGMVLRPNRVTLEPGQVFKLEVIIPEGMEEDPPQDVDLEWNSTDLDVVFPLGDGLIQAAGLGQATIEADYRHWTARATVEVIHPRERALGRGR